MFSQLRPLLRIAKALEEIARALSYFAIADARENQRFYTPSKPRWTGKDESELLHTDSQHIQQLRQEEYAKFLQQGYSSLEASEIED